MEVPFVRLYVDVRKFGVRVRNLMPVRVLQRITGFQASTFCSGHILYADTSGYPPCPKSAYDILRHFIMGSTDRRPDDGNDVLRPAPLPGKNLHGLSGNLEDSSLPAGVGEGNALSNRVDEIDWYAVRE